MVTGGRLRQDICTDLEVDGSERGCGVYRFWRLLPGSGLEEENCSPALNSAIGRDVRTNGGLHVPPLVGFSSQLFDCSLATGVGGSSCASCVLIHLCKTHTEEQFSTNISCPQCQQSSGSHTAEPLHVLGPLGWSSSVPSRIPGPAEETPAVPAATRVSPK